MRKPLLKIIVQVDDLDDPQTLHQLRKLKFAIDSLLSAVDPLTGNMPDGLQRQAMPRKPYTSRAQYVPHILCILQERPCGIREIMFDLTKRLGSNAPAIIVVRQILAQNKNLFVFVGNKKREGFWQLVTDQENQNIERVFQTRK